MRSAAHGVSVIHNEFVTSKELSEKIRRKRRRGLIRRLMAFFILLSLTVGSLYSVILKQDHKLIVMQQQKLNTQQSLAKVTSQQQAFKHQIALLNNKNYIGDLARQKYYMSKKGEIIFASPNSTQH